MFGTKDVRQDINDSDVTSTLQNQFILLKLICRFSSLQLLSKWNIRSNDPRLNYGKTGGVPFQNLIYLRIVTFFLEL